MSCQQPQMKVDQTTKFDNGFKKKRKSNGNQVISKGGQIIRPDKRKRPHYL